MTPKISIIVSTFNSAKTVTDTLSSILHQTYTNFEVIVQDGQSSDNTLDIIRQFCDDRINILSTPDNGIYDAMNKGLSRASGDIIAILNSDDFYNSNYVLSSVVQLMQDEGSDCLYGDLEYVDENDTKKIVRKWVSGEYSQSGWLKGWMPPHPTFFVRKEVYSTFGKFNLELKTSADYELMLRFLYKNKRKVSYLPEILVKMRTGGQSNASIRNRLKANKEDKIAWKINGLKPKWYTLYLKPLRKIKQYI